MSNVSFTADSVSFKTRSVGISNAVGPYLAVFQIDSTSPLSGENFLGCAELPGNPCVLNSGLNVFTPGFGSSGDQAVVNDTIEWSDPVGLTGFADPSDELAAVENGGLLAEITGDQLKIWDYCPSSCGVTGLDWTFQNLGPTAPEPDSIMLFASGFLGLGVMTYRKRKSVA